MPERLKEITVSVKGTVDGVGIAELVLTRHDNSDEGGSNIYLEFCHAVEEGESPQTDCHGFLSLRDFEAFGLLLRNIWSGDQTSGNVGVLHLELVRPFVPTDDGVKKKFRLGYKTCFDGKEYVEAEFLADRTFYYAVQDLVNL